MSRTAVTWLCFALGAAVVATAVGWVTYTATNLDQAQRDLQRQITSQQTTRLALWRMDSAAMPWLAAENMRPFTFYQRQGRTPLSSQPQPQRAVRLYFQFAPDGELTSPQLAPIPPSPGDHAADDLATIRQRLAPDRLLARLPKAEPRTGTASTDGIAATAVRKLRASRPDDDAPSADASLQEQQRAYAAKSAKGTARDYAQRQSSMEIAGLANNNFDRQNQRVVVNNLVLSQTEGEQQAASQIEGVAVDDAQQLEPVAVDELNRQLQFRRQSGAPVLLGVGGVQTIDLPPHAWLLATYDAMQPMVIDDMPLLVRRVTVDGQVYIQGCWLDWPWVEAQLLDEVGDLLPSAKLALLSDAPPPAEGTPVHRLAALPVRLTPGVVPLPALPASPLRTALVVAWVCLIAGTLAVGVVLFGVMQLSHRRAAFVRAVTHEMRTPLTTFQLYTDLLASGRVTDAEQQQHYVATLYRESERLSHMVENVLAHARLERRQKPAALAEQHAGTMLDRAWDRLTVRPEQAGMKLIRRDLGDAAHTAVRADPGTVEQILLNLVDNACKYADKAADKQIAIELEARPRDVLIRVVDHGPGLPPAQRRRLFRPFNKSADEAALSAPGVGLGLSLSRRLARAMGGDLRLNAQHTDGAAFELSLCRA